MSAISIKTISGIEEKRKSIIRLLAVATFQKAHGYERLIKGLSQYYQGQGNRRFELYFVGDGGELVKYKKLVKQYGLEDYVLFCGRKSGDDLDYIYDSMDIALGSFGSYKRKIYRSSALKIREYLAKGMPIVSGCCEDAFEQTEQYKYYLEFPNDSTIVDMQLIVNFYNDIYETGIERAQIRGEIREYAKRKVDMSITMLPVMEYIDSFGNGEI